MNCPVCFQPCDQVLARGNCTEVVCLGCGHFQISRALHSALRLAMFDVPAARQRLQQRRDTTPVPMLGAADEDLLRPK
jgi:hypothetical protein